MDQPFMYRDAAWLVRGETMLNKRAERMLDTPIKPTPVLIGKDAARFIKAINRIPTRVRELKSREDYLRAKAIYQAIEAKKAEVKS